MTTPKERYQFDELNDKAKGDPMRYTFEATYPALGNDKELLQTTADSVDSATENIYRELEGCGCARSNVLLRLVARHNETPVLAESEKLALNALDPALTPLCVSFVGMQETPSRSFGLYNVEETIDDNLVLHSTVSLQTIAAYGYRPVMI